MVFQFFISFIDIVSVIIQCKFIISKLDLLINSNIGESKKLYEVGFLFLSNLLIIIPI